MQHIRWIIDGYNLLHAAGLGSSHYGAGELQRARDRLLRRIGKVLSPSELAVTIVVFDAREAPTHLPRRWLLHGLQVEFAPPEEDGDADAWIEDLVARHGAPAQLTVVSGDHRLRRAAQHRGARWLESVEFLVERQQSRAEKLAAEIPVKPEPTSQDLVYWTNVFASVRAEDLTVSPPTRPARMTALPPAPPKRAQPPTVTKGSPSPVPPSNPPKRSGPSSLGTPPVATETAEWVRELQEWVDGEQQRHKRGSS